MESWSFDRDGRGYVLRRAPSAALMAGRAFGHDVEATLVRAARAHGVRAPEVVGELVAADDLGTGYLMSRVEAEISPARILAAPAPGLLDDLGRELARIHAVPLAALPAGLPQLSTSEMIAALRAQFERHGGDRPVMALALAWLAAHLPAEVEPVLVHGDFRMGNLMADAGGLAAVLDWELARIGDRHQDLAYGCIGSWRFTRHDRPAFGLGEVYTLSAAYTAESGVTVDPARFRFWLVHATLWWGLCCLEMADINRSGRDPGLERAVIGRRASETEVDLLLLLEEDAPPAEQGAIALPEALAPRRQGEPSAPELLEALARWVETDVKPHAEGRDRFLANVALNALGMLAREGAPAEDRALSDDLLTGRTNLATPGLLTWLKAAVLAKLAADQPKYPGLAAARAKWERPDAV